VTVDRGYAGIIEHREIEGAPVTCSLTLRAPAAGSYISIPGVYAAEEDATCPEIEIDGTIYCIYSREPGIIQKFTPEQSVLSVSTLSNMAGFNLEFFTTGKLLCTNLLFYADAYHCYKPTIKRYMSVTVTSCGEDIQIPDTPQVEQLTGIFTSSYTTNKQSLPSCEFTISNLPSEAHYVRFDIITELTESSRISWFIDNQEFANFPDGFLHNITSTNNQLSVRYEQEPDPVSGDVHEAFFMIKFTGE